MHEQKLFLLCRKLILQFKRNKKDIEVKFMGNKYPTVPHKIPETYVLK